MQMRDFSQLIKEISAHDAACAETYAKEPATLCQGAPEIDDRAHTLLDLCERTWLERSSHSRCACVRPPQIRTATLIWRMDHAVAMPQPPGERAGQRLSAALASRPRRSRVAASLERRARSWHRGGFRVVGRVESWARLVGMLGRYALAARTGLGWQRGAA